MKDPLYKISPLMEGVRKNSIRKYNLHQEVSVDEAMIKCHGQHWTIIGAPNKPAKRGFKVFVAADAVTGFLWNFQVYFRRKKEIGLTQRVVENLTEDIAERNHIIFVDKFYTSVPLALSLLEKSTFLCGSFNTGRKHWPVDLKVDKRKKKKEDKIRTLKRGEYLTKQTTDGKLVATVWQDSRTVFNLSTCHNPITNARRDKVERKHMNAAGKWEKSDFPCPEAIVEFNKYMVGVDRHDHLRSSYSLQRSSTRWWTYFVWFAIDMALINAFLMYKDINHKATHKKFQLKVAEQLLGGYSDRICTPKQVDTTGMSSLFAASHEAKVMLGRARVCRYCSKIKKQTGSGRTRETTYGCAQCGVNIHRECFLLYHQAGIQKQPGRDVGVQTDIVKTPTKLRSTAVTETRTLHKRPGNASLALYSQGQAPKKVKTDFELPKKVEISETPKRSQNQKLHGESRKDTGNEKKNISKGCSGQRHSPRKKTKK